MEERRPMEIKTISYRMMLNNFVNCYLVRTEDGYFLIDTGMPNRRLQIQKDIEDTGCHQGDLKFIILTHGDVDHSGNAAYFRKQFDAKIAMHVEDISMVEKGDMFAGRKHASPIIKTLSNRFFGINKPDRFTPDLTIEDGYDFTPYGFNARVLHLPGHTRGSIEILTTEGNLFCGDMLGNIIKPSRFSLIDDPIEAQKSINRIKALDVKMVYPGHGKPFPISALEF